MAVDNQKIIVIALPEISIKQKRDQKLMALFLPIL